jgi:hypothetical protein
MSNAIIPFGIGILLIAFPQWFTKPSSPNFEANRKTYKTIGIVLVSIGIGYCIVTTIG